MSDTTELRLALIPSASVAELNFATIARGALAILVALGIGFSTFASQAGDSGKFHGVSPEMKQWIGSLNNKDGIHCCTAVGGFRPKQVEWRIGLDSYFVKVGGAWLFVPDEAVIKGPNLLGHAVVWIEPGGDLDVEKDSALVHCFLPGAAS